MVAAVKGSEVNLRTSRYKIVVQKRYMQSLTKLYGGACIRTALCKLYGSGRKPAIWSIRERFNYGSLHQC